MIRSNALLVKREESGVNNNGLSGITQVVLTRGTPLTTCMKLPTSC